LLLSLTSPSRSKIGYSMDEPKVRAKFIPLKRVGVPKGIAMFSRCVERDTGTSRARHIIAMSQYLHRNSRAPPSTTWAHSEVARVMRLWISTTPL